MQDEMLEKLNLILIRLDKIEEDIRYLKDGNDSMTEHISFIENVYDTIKNPFYFILSKIKPLDNIPEKPKSLKQ
jgi:hypothetical protein